jgi:hypothetical protein
MGKKVSKVIKKVVTTPAKVAAKVLPVSALSDAGKKTTITPAAAAEPTLKETQATAREESKAVYDSAARRVRRGRAAGYRALMTDRGTLGGGGSTLG